MTIITITIFNNLFFYYFNVCDYIRDLIINIINIGIIISTIIIDFMTLLLLWHHWFIPCNTYCISSLFSVLSLLLLNDYHYCYFISAIFLLSLLLPLLLHIIFYSYYHQYYMNIILIIIDSVRIIITIINIVIIMLSLRILHYYFILFTVF